METSNVLSIPEAVATGDKSQIAGAILTADNLQLLQYCIKIFIVIGVAVVGYLVLHNILKIFKVKLVIPFIKLPIGDERGFTFNKPNAIPDEFIQSLQKSIINMSDNIASVTHDKYVDLSSDTREKILNYIQKVIHFYQSYVADESTSSPEEKKVYLMSSSLEYLKELMTLAAYDSGIIDKTMETIIEMLEQRRIGGPANVTEATKQSIIATITSSFSEPFNTHHYPFEEKIDHKSASEVIERSAKKQVAEIIEDLEGIYSNKTDIYQNKIRSIVKTYLASVDGISPEDIK